MKKTGWLLGCTLACTAPLHADYQKGNQSLTFNLGSAGYSDDVNVNNGDDKLKGGGSGGIQYLYFLHNGPTLAIGPDILWTNLSQKDSSNLVFNSESHGAEHTALYQAVMKLAYPKGHWRPYVLGGIGASRASLQGDITPPSGTAIQTFDSIRYGFAGTWGLGMEFFPREHWFFGLELRQSILSRLLHEPTTDGAALGIQPVRDPGSITTLLLHVGYKFGAH